MLTSCLASGQVVSTWTDVLVLNVSNSSALLKWQPPTDFLQGATVEKYLLIGGIDPTNILHLFWFNAEEREYNITNLEANTNYTGKLIVILSDKRRGSTSWIPFKTEEGSKSTIFVEVH